MRRTTEQIQTLSTSPFTQEHTFDDVSSTHTCACACVFWSHGWVCTRRRDEKVNVHVCTCLFFILSHLCLCTSVGLERVNASWHMQFTDLLQESRLPAKPSHTQVSMETRKINYISSLPQQDSKMLKCTNTLSLPSRLIFNRVRLFCVLFALFSELSTHHLEILPVTFPQVIFIFDLQKLFDGLYIPSWYKKKYIIS